ncbi:GON4L [Lepeophtheirus salmonis]|uniref:GON4L n=1 Tax=Lepeophtheirus salmonis TaxID=72036 RepID=A0A7R8CWU2_LEPSM|nr:GON4L [Lepeophtheirus salmonis]CAF2924800.1 GON4L [Lepeophtheirus salmonis]
MEKLDKTPEKELETFLGEETEEDDEDEDVDDDEEDEEEDVNPEEEEEEDEEELAKAMALAKEEEEIESVLESKAKKLNMNRTQVRTLLRQIVGSKEVINHSLEIAGDKDRSATVIEPRVTRTVAKSVAEVGVNEDDTLVLVTQELPDDDKPEEDPEYDPETDDIEGEDDMEDSCMTPLSSIAQTPPCPKHLLESPSTSQQSYKMDNPNSVTDDEEQRRLTRSKTSLKEVSIEELEKKFIPPDITSDMYSTEMDEYSMFLQETFGYQEPVPTNSSTIQEEDPDFIYQDIEETADNQYEFKFDRSTKIPRKEVDDLISELLAEYEDSKKEKNKETKPQTTSTITTTATTSTTTDDSIDKKSVPSSSSTPFLSVDKPNVAIEYSEISDEHILRINNLFPSMKFLQDWEEGGKSPSVQCNEGKNKTKSKISKELVEAIGESTCFIYPYLLPSSALRSSYDKSYFSEAEDFLIVYGLDKYTGMSKKEVYRLITTHLMPSKNMNQIRWRIKNKRSKSDSNAINTYLHTGIIRQIEDPIIPYNSADVVPPKYCNSGELPEEWCVALHIHYDPSRASKHPMLTKSSINSPSSFKIRPIAKQGVLLYDSDKKESNNKKPTESCESDLPLNQQSQTSITRSPINPEKASYLSISPSKISAEDNPMDISHLPYGVMDTNERTTSGSTQRTRRNVSWTRSLFSDDPVSMEMVVNGLQDIVSKDPSQLHYGELQTLAQNIFKSNLTLYNEFLSFLPNVILEDQVFTSQETFLPKQNDIEQGSDNCVCMCHTPEESIKKVHCVHCSLRFVNGQVYRKDGKITRSLQVAYKVVKDLTNVGNEVPRKKRRNIF